MCLVQLWCASTCVTRYPNKALLIALFKATSITISSVVTGWGHGYNGRPPDSHLVGADMYNILILIDL